MRLSRPAKAALVGILVIVILGILSSVARAQSQQCGPAAEVVAELATKFGEAPIFSGDTGNSRIVMMVNSDTGTWTALMLQGGLACIRAAGTSFATVPVKPNA